ncbi:MAG TPA: hypothetical protein VEI03_22645 [Stellaceae bacterium]|nr:hypothetical protein [Stellaceae bacterium]
MSCAEPCRCAALWLAAAALAAVAPARAADLKINPPSLEEGEVELEDNSAALLDRGRSGDADQTHFGEFGYGIRDYWWIEAETHWDNADNGFRSRTLDFENAVRLQPQADYWPESAVFLEYDHAVDGRSPETATVGGLFHKDVGPSSTVLNLLFDHDLGRNAQSGVRLRYSGTSTWEITDAFAPGVEFFGVPGKLPGFDRAGAQDHRLGPVLAGAVEIEGLGEFGYTAGYLFGLSPGAPNGTLVWRLELDVKL